MNSQRRRVLAAGIAAAGVAFGAVVSAQPKERVIRVTARKWAFLPREIRLKKGVPVVLEFVTADVVMGFNAPDFNVRADIIPGQVARVRLVPDKTGTFVPIPHCCTKPIPYRCTTLTPHRRTRP